MKLMKTMGMLAAFALAVLPLGFAASASAGEKPNLVGPAPMVKTFARTNLNAVKDHGTTKVAEVPRTSDVVVGGSFVAFTQASAVKPTYTPPADPIANSVQPDGNAHAMTIMYTPQYAGGSPEDGVYVCTAGGTAPWAADAPDGIGLDSHTPCHALSSEHSGPVAN